LARLNALIIEDHDLTTASWSSWNCQEIYTLLF